MKIFSSHGTDSRLTKYDGQRCTVIRPLDATEADEEVGPMFKVRFEDGHEADAFEDELYDWSGSPCPDDPDNFWIDDATGERIPA